VIAPGYNFVFEHVARRHGFTSSVWHSASAIGVKSGIEPKAKLFCRRYGFQLFYNVDQLKWPIAASDLPQRWINGGNMLPHDQLLLSGVREEQGFRSRVWASASFQSSINNVRLGATPTILTTAVPYTEYGALNLDQLIDVRFASKAAE
jgi:hypothetical protein